MKERKMILDSSACVHCNKCKKACLFLDKYDIDIGNELRLRELAYNCFLCGRCSEVCPKNIDGREIILNMRRDEVRAGGGKLSSADYKLLLFEKKDYIFKNYKRAAKKSVLFPGCNFPSFYPKATKQIAAILSEAADIGLAFDCCGKPIAELGLEDDEKRIISSLNERFSKHGIEELVCLCPNCYHYLKPRLDIGVVNIFEKMRELGLGKSLKADIEVFLPCPDREPRSIYSDIEYFVDGSMQAVNTVQCCGLGGCAIVKERELAKQMAGSFSALEKDIYTYCATCAGNMKRNNCDSVKHLALVLLDIEEEADTKGSVLNRAKTKFI